MARSSGDHSCQLTRPCARIGPCPYMSWRQLGWRHRLRCLWRSPWLVSKSASCWWMIFWTTIPGASTSAWGWAERPIWRWLCRPPPTGCGWLWIQLLERRHQVSTCLQEMALATAAGQELDMQPIVGEAGYWQLVSAKSTPFYAAALESGAILGGVSETARHAIRESGRAVWRDHPDHG